MTIHDDGWDEHTHRSTEFTADPVGSPRSSSREFCSVRPPRAAAGDKGRRRVPPAHELLPGGARGRVPEPPERAQRLEDRARQAAALAALGEAALAEPDLDHPRARLRGARRAPARRLRQRPPDRAGADRLVLRTGGAGRRSSSASAACPAAGVLAGFVMQTRQPVVMDDVEREQRFAAPELMRTVGIEQPDRSRGPEEEPSACSARTAGARALHHRRRLVRPGRRERGGRGGTSSARRRGAARARAQPAPRALGHAHRRVVVGRRRRRVRWSENLPGCTA